MSLLIKGGKLIDPKNKIEYLSDIYIEDNLIKEIGKDIKGATNCEVIDATNLVIMPGLIDMHVHLRELGQEAKEDFESGSQAAVAGGFTTVATMPNTKPVVDSSALVNALNHRADAVSRTNIKIIGALTKEQAGHELAEIGDMISVGAVAISDDGHYVTNTALFRSGLEYTSMYDVPIITHAEDYYLTKDGVMNESTVSAMLGMKGRPTVAEDIAVMRDTMLAEYVDAPIHIAHVSSKNAVEIIRQAKKRGVRVTAEVTPHHLTLTDECVASFDTATKVNPPLRGQEDVLAMLEGLKDNTIDMIVTDHSPHAYEEKDVEYKNAPSGFTGLETSLGVILTDLYHEGKLSLLDIATFMSYNPAQVFKLSNRDLAVGQTADLTLIDINHEWTVDSKLFYTRGKATPFEGKKMRGKAMVTIVNGKIAMKNGEVF